MALLLMMVLLAWQAHTLYQWGRSATGYSANHEQKVILYATSWCGYCEKTRQFLKNKNISYFEYDVEKSLEGKRQMDDLGGEAVPLLLIDGRLVKGYRPAEILERIKQL